MKKKLALGLFLPFSLIFCIFLLPQIQKETFAQQETQLSCGPNARLWGEWCVFTGDDDVPDKILQGIDNLYHPAVWREGGKIHMLVGGWKDKEKQGYHDQIFRYISNDYDYGISGWSLYQGKDPYIGNDWDSPKAHHTVQPSIFAGEYPGGFPCCKTVYYSWDALGEFPENQVTINNAFINAGGELTHGGINPSVAYGYVIPECGGATVLAVSNGHIFFDEVSEKFFLYYNSWLDQDTPECGRAVTSVAHANWTNKKFTPVVNDLLGEGTFGGSPFVIKGPNEKYYLFFDKWLDNQRAEIRMRTSDSPVGPFNKSTEKIILKVPDSEPDGLIAASTPFIFCNKEINKWQIYFAGHTSKRTDAQIYTAFSPLGITCDDPPYFSVGQGDLNNDGQVNSQDLKILIENWGDFPSIPEADLNSDRIVNGLDFGELRKLLK